MLHSHGIDPAICGRQQLDNITETGTALEIGNGIRACRAVLDKCIVARAEPILSATIQDVAATLAIDAVVSGTTQDLVIPKAAAQIVRLRIADQNIREIAPDYVLDPGKCVGAVRTRTRTEELPEAINGIREKDCTPPVALK